MAIEWTRSITLALASHKCAQCHGLGLRGLTCEIPCDCVLRAIYRICYGRFVDFSRPERFMSQVTYEETSSSDRPRAWGRKEEEYIADFVLLAKRTLDELDYKIFRYHFLLGADYRLCARKLGLDKGTYFNRLYSIEKRMGRACVELEPFSLFPVSEYFKTPVPCSVRAFMPDAPKVVPIRPPLSTILREAAELGSWDGENEGEDDSLLKCA